MGPDLTFFENGKELYNKMAAARILELRRAGAPGGSDLGGEEAEFQELCAEYSLEYLPPKK